MDFHSLARRDLQALCKLNAIPANITNLAMADALSSLNVVEGIEDFLNRSPERKAVTAAKVPRTGRRTATQSKPIGDGSESVQPLTTRRTVRRGISDEIMAESKTPAIRSSRKAVELVNAESQGTENVVKKDVSDTPGLATYTKRNQVARKSSVKEVSTVQRVYSTRRSARLSENIAVEEKEEKIDSLVSELSRIDLEDGSDDKSLSVDNAEVVLQASVEKSDAVALVTENEKEGDALEEVVEELEEKSEQLVESQFLADSVVFKNEDNEVLEYAVDDESSNEQKKFDEAAPESGTKPKEDAQEIVVDELKEKSEQCEVESNNVMLEDENSEVEKPLGAGEENETNKNLESVVKATAELSAGGDSYLSEEHMTYSDESSDEMETEDEMDSEVEPSIEELEVVQEITHFEESKAKENATGTEISSIAPSDEAEGKPVAKPLSVKGLNSVSDDKENIDRSGLTIEEAKKDKKEIIPAAKELNAKSLRELTKMLKEKLQISNNTAEDIGKVTKERPALQKLEDNCQW